MFTFFLPSYLTKKYIKQLWMGSGEGALGYENIWLEERIQPHRFSDGRRSVLNLVTITCNQKKFLTQKSNS